MSQARTVKRGIVVAFMAISLGLMFGAIGGPAQAGNGVTAAEVSPQAGVTYDQYNCYVQWYNTYGKNVCGAASSQPNWWVSLGLWCKASFDYVGPEYHIKKGEQRDPIDGAECTFSVGGGKNTWG